MNAVRLAADQTALLTKPELVLDLLAFGLGRLGFRLRSPAGATQQPAGVR